MFSFFFQRCETQTKQTDRQRGNLPSRTFSTQMCGVEKNKAAIKAKQPVSVIHPPSEALKDNSKKKKENMIYM